MDKQAIWWAGFFAGSVSTTVVNWALQYVYSTLKRNKDSQRKIVDMKQSYLTTVHSLYLSE